MLELQDPACLRILDISAANASAGYYGPHAPPPPGLQRHLFARQEANLGLANGFNPACADPALGLIDPCTTAFYVGREGPTIFFQAWRARLLLPKRGSGANRARGVLPGLLKLLLIRRAPDSPSSPPCLNTQPELEIYVGPSPACDVRCDVWEE